MKVLFQKYYRKGENVSFIYGKTGHFRRNYKSLLKNDRTDMIQDTNHGETTLTYYDYGHRKESSFSPNKGVGFDTPKLA